MKKITNERRQAAALGICRRDHAATPDSPWGRALALLDSLEDLPAHERPFVFVCAIGLASLQSADPKGVIATAHRLLDELPLDHLPDDDEVRRFFEGQS